MIRLAENIEGAALYMVHVSAATGVAAIAASRARGFPIYGETLHQYLLYTAEDYKRPGGQMFHTYPSLKFAKDQEALWAATNHGAIQAVATDEVCCPLKVKLQGRRIDDTTGGNSGVEPRLSLMYTHMVEKRGYSLADFVGLTSSNAARSWASTRAKARWRSARTPTSCCSTRAPGASSARRICTRPTTRRGRATRSPPGRA